MDTGIENRSYSFPYLDMRQIGGRYSDVEYLLFVFRKLYYEMEIAFPEEKQKAGNMLLNAWRKL